MNNILIHIGFHKTGTTWLQNNVFSNGTLGFATLFNRPQVTSDFVTTDYLDFNHDVLHDKYEPQVRQCWTRGLVPVVSHERLSGYAASGGFDRYGIAHRLAAVFHSGLILIVIREQRSMLLSWYKQYIKDGGNLPIRRFLNPAREIPYRVPQFRAEFFEYDRIFKLYSSLFGTSNILVLPYELLCKSPALYLQTIVDFAGACGNKAGVDFAKTNIGLGAVAVSLYRYLNAAFNVNQLTPSAIWNIPNSAYYIDRFCERVARWIPKAWNRSLNAKWRGYIESWASERYQSSNSRLVALIRTELTQYGYLCS